MPRKKKSMPKKRTKPSLKAPLTIRVLILLFCMGMVALVFTASSWIGPYFDRLPSWIPYPKILLAMMVFLGYPALLALIDIGMGRTAPSVNNFFQAYFREAAELTVDVTVVLLIAFLVSFSVFFWVTTAFFMAMTLAGLTFGYRWIIGEFQPVFDQTFIIVILIYLGLLAYLFLCILFKSKIDSLKEKYENFVARVQSLTR